MPDPTFTLDGRVLAVSYGRAVYLDRRGLTPIVDLDALARSHAAAAPVWSWLAAHGIARPDTSATQ